MQVSQIRCPFLQDFQKVQVNHKLLVSPIDHGFIPHDITTCRLPTNYGRQDDNHDQCEIILMSKSANIVYYVQSIDRKISSRE